MRELPTGTVTFLFSDIEGSTKLLQRAGEDGYRELLAAQAEEIRRATAASGGIEISTEGDSFFLVFTSPADAVRAAVEAQRGLAAREWPEGHEVRVRMGIHTGEGRLGGDNYAGIDVNRGARLTSTGHGGQVLVSDTTRALVERSLPEGVSLRDLGQHRLKDLEAPEHLHQLVIEGLQTDFPPPRTIDARPNNLPPERTRFIGRQEVLAYVLGLLRETRLLTLTGPGGTGKTRLALKAARELLMDFEDGAFFVDLSPITDARLVAPTVAEALGIPEDATRPRSEVLKEALADREMLLVLDNFEQVTDAADLVADVLEAAPQVTMLVTSRIPLHVYGEREFPVPPLILPDWEALPDAETVSQYEAVALFIDRATGVKPDFRVTNENAPAVAEICYRLDGLPLAIELAAARVKLLGPQAMLPRLQRSLDVLTSGARDLPERQRTLRGAIAWSYELLDEPEKRLFARLGAFMGGAALESVETVCDPGGELGLDMFEALGSLVDKSLLRQVETPEGELRFVMLETIREFAVEQLEASGEADVIRRRHAEHFMGLAEEAEPHLTGERQVEWLARVDREHDNIRAALRWCIDTGEAELGMGIAGPLWRFFHQRGHLREGRGWLQDLVAMPGAAVRSRARARALTGLGGLAYWQNDFAAARVHYTEAVELYRELADPKILAGGLFDLSYIEWADRQYDEAIALLNESAELAEHAGDEEQLANSRIVLGWVKAAQGDRVGSLEAIEDSLAVFRRLGNRFVIADSVAGVGQIAGLMGDFEKAMEAYREALELFEEANNPTGIAQVFYSMAAMEIVRGDWERALRLMGANDAIREAVGGGAPPEIMSTLLGEPDREAREQLDPQTAERAYEEGRAMPMDKAIAYALEEREASPSEPG